MALYKPSQPINQGTFIEENEDHNTRSMIWKARRLNRLWEPGSNKYTNPKPKVNMHWGLQIGNYLYQIHTEEGEVKYLLVERLHGKQIWAPDVPQETLGYCNLTDTEVKSAADAVEKRMRGSHLFTIHKDYQSFVTWLVDEISRYEDTVLPGGCAKIEQLTRWQYENQPYYKELPHKILKKIQVTMNKMRTMKYEDNKGMIDGGEDFHTYMDKIRDKFSVQYDKHPAGYKEDCSEGTRAERHEAGIEGEEDIS